jgi:hypothetical protein
MYHNKLLPNCVLRVSIVTKWVHLDLRITHARLDFTVPLVLVINTNFHAQQELIIQILELKIIKLVYNVLRNIIVNSKEHLNLQQKFYLVISTYKKVLRSQIQ